PALHGAMNADIGILVSLEQVEGGGTKRVARTTIHPILEATIVGRIALDHFLGPNPARPLTLRVDCSGTLELQPLFAHSNAVAASRRRRFNEIKETLFRVDHDRAGLIASKGDFLRPELGIDIVLAGFYRIAALGSLF